MLPTSIRFQNQGQTELQNRTFLNLLWAYFKLGFIERKLYLDEAPMSLEPSSTSRHNFVRFSSFMLISGSSRLITFVYVDPRFGTTEPDFHEDDAASLHQEQEKVHELTKQNLHQIELPH